MRNRAITSTPRLLGIGLLVVLAGCTAGPGGCDPIDDGSSTTTTDPGASTTTEPVATSTTVAGEGSTTTTTVDPGATTTTVEPGSTTTTVPGTSGQLTGIGDVEVEDCLTPTTDEVMIAEVTVVDCDEPHRMEVFAQFELDRGAVPGTGDQYPGGNELTWYAQDECQARFEGYTGHSYWTSPFDLRALTPSFSTWDTGDRLITCLIVSGDGGELTGATRAGR